MKTRSFFAAIAGAAALLASPLVVPAAAAPGACPPAPVRVVRSAGGMLDYTGTAPGLPELCRVSRADGDGDFYFGIWRSDWPGAGQAFPALLDIMNGPAGTERSFVTRSVPGLQWEDRLVNEGTEPLIVDGRTYQTLRVAHERTGIEGNTYHSIITSWRDQATGITLKTVEHQIAGQSYGPATTWVALKVTPLR